MAFLYQEDLDLQKEYFKEAAYLMGKRVLFYAIKKAEKDIYTDMEREYENPVEVDVIWEDHPRISTLKKLGWFSEDPDNSPIVAHFPFDLEGLERYTKVEIPSATYFGGPREFEITDVATYQEYPAFWTCRLVPLFTQKEIEINKSKSFNIIQPVVNEELEETW